MVEEMPQRCPKPASESDVEMVSRRPVYVGAAPALIALMKAVVIAPAAFVPAPAGAPQDSSPSWQPENSRTSASANESGPGALRRPTLCRVGHGEWEVQARPRMAAVKEAGQAHPLAAAVRDDQRADRQ